MIFVIGHQKPDLDSIVSAYALADLLTKKGTPATPKIASEKVGQAARWLFEKYALELPEHLADAADAELFLVDHTEPAQSPNGIAGATVIGVLDHHPVGDGIDYPAMEIDMVGSTATLIAEKYFAEDIAPSREVAAILLAAILDDTVIFRSPTVTARDKEVAKKLAKIADIKNLQHFGVDIFTAKSNWDEMTEKEMLEADAKEWDINGHLIYCAAIETVDGQGVMARRRGILEALRAKKTNGGFELVMALVVDILEQESWVIVDPADREVPEAIINGAVDDDGVMPIAGVISRKKQVLKPINEYFGK